MAQMILGSGAPMNLEQRVVAELGLRDLQAIASEHGLPVADRRRKDALSQALLDAFDRSALLNLLDLETLRRLCRDLSLPADGQTTELRRRLLEGGPVSQARRTFVAIDFETADYGRDSACAIGLVRVENGEIVAREVRLIRPPRRSFVFTYIHGITWARVAREPAFGEVWPGLRPLLEGAEFLAAHNAPFDRGVLRACCLAAGLEEPPHPFVDTVKVARDAWKLYPTKLPDVCRHLGLSLNHHEAASDAEACARIVIAAGADRRP